MNTRLILKTKGYKISGELLLAGIENQEIDYNNFSKVLITEDKVTTIIEADQKGKIKDCILDEKLNGKSLYSFAYSKVQEYYKQIIRSRYSEIENLVILTGAGSSVGIGKTNKGLTMSGLWDTLKSDDLKSLTELIKSTNSDWLDKEGVILEENVIKDLESLLSKAGMKNIVQKSKELTDAIENTKKFIASKCTLEQAEESSHKLFLNKIMLRPQKNSRVKLFTTNYDTLFEQAARDEMFTVIDGFTFSSPRVFNGKYFDYDIIETRHNRQDKKDNIIPKLFYLYKMHGSLNWKINNGRVEQSESENIEKIEDRVMIFPQDSKFEHSYEQPYFEMMSRFQESLRNENTLLITIGFSYLDKHISSVIIESLKQNPSLNLISFTFPEIVNNDKDHQKELHQIAELQSRVTLIADTFSSIAENYPENIAHKRFDLLEELNQNLKQAIQSKDGNTNS